MLVDFFGYAGDCTISGKLDVAGNRRLSEMLERADDLVVRQARLLGLHGEPERWADQLTLGREDLYAVEATEQGGGGERRIHTVRHLVRFRCGPYTIIGELHALPGAPPLRAVFARRSMVPLTGCLVSYERAGRRQLHRAAVVIINGWRIDSAEPVSLDDPDAELVARLAADEGGRSA